MAHFYVNRCRPSIWDAHQEAHKRTDKKFAQRLEEVDFAGRSDVL